MDEVVSEAQTKPSSFWTAASRPWGRADLLALLVWTIAILVFFHDAALLRKALFYFDVTEINYPYRDFLAHEIKLGRFARWMPGLLNGFPLYSESQAGYWHPLKYVLYPWMETWKAFNLDTVLSVWLTGLATYGWLRRHVNAAGALTGAATFGLSGFVWAHLIHTSMTNALISVPIVIWSLECAWSSGKLRGLAIGAIALACQVFAGHLQDTILTSGIVGLYGLHRALTERDWPNRARAFGFAIGLVTLGMIVAAVQWIPSKELLDRSPRAGGLSWEQLTYGSWSPELLPTLVVREAYGARARDTDWPDGYYPYHEMNAYLGLIAMGLAVVGAGVRRDRWVGFWILLALVGSLMMLGRYTCVFDFMNRVPVLGSSRIPVRYHLWVSLAVAALASVGVDRLSRPGVVKLNGVLVLGGLLVIAAIAVALSVYAPLWNSVGRWNTPYHINRFRWLAWEVGIASARTAILGLVAWALAAQASASADSKRRAWLAAGLPVLVILDLLGSHNADVPTISPTYWTQPPPSVAYLKSEPSLKRVFGTADRSSGEPGYASEDIDFFAARDPLAWSLAPVWGLSSSAGETPMYARRLLKYTDHAKAGLGRFDIESVSHLLANLPITAIDRKAKKVGATYISRNSAALPRARIAGQPVYADSEDSAAEAMDRLEAAIRERLVVEDPTRPLAEDSAPTGTAEITVDEPERVVVSTHTEAPAYLLLADTFDPGWSVTIDGVPGVIRPAYIAFRAVYLDKGAHKVEFRYRPAGFVTGLIVTGVGVFVVLALLIWPKPVATFRAEHDELAWPARWPWAVIGVIVVIIAASAIGLDPKGAIRLHSRWDTAFHRFTWGAGIEAIPAVRGAIGR